MHSARVMPLPWWRLFLYSVIFGVCGAVTLYELYCYLAGAIVTGRILTVAKSGSGRGARYRADYEYFDEMQVRHVGQANGVPPATNPGDAVEVQYTRHSP